MPPGVHNAQHGHAGPRRGSALSQAAQIKATPAGAAHNAQSCGSPQRDSAPIRLKLANELSNNFPEKFDISRGLVNTAGAHHACEGVSQDARADRYRPSSERMTEHTTIAFHPTRAGNDAAMPSRWTVAAIADLFSLPFADLIFRAQQVHRTHHPPNAVQLSTLISIKTAGV